MTVSPSNARRALVAALSASLLAATVVLPASGTSAAKRAKPSTLGRTAATPNPNCPTPKGQNPPADETCQVVNRVTGFQINADGGRGPFKVRKPGTIVSWSVDLSRPSKSEQRFFAEEIRKSGPPEARLSILRPKGEGEFKLTKQSPVVQLQPYLKERPVFTLSEPMRVRKGRVVALTTTSWISNLAVKGASRSDKWRASRQQGECGTEPNDAPSENEADLKRRSRPQQGVGGTRTYACTYSGARMLYWAHYVPRSPRD